MESEPRMGTAYRRAISKFSNRPGEICRDSYMGLLCRMSPERLAQQRAYDSERGRNYYQEHKESRSQYSKDWRENNKDQMCEKHARELCGGRYTMRKKAQHCATKKHQHAMASQGT